MNRFVLFLSASLFSSLGAAAQDCLAGDLKKGSVLEMTSYDAKQKVTGRAMQTVTAMENSNGTVKTTFHQQHFDAKNKPLMEGDFSLECTGDLLRLDMRAMAGQGEAMRSMENLDLEMEGDKLDMPLTATVGQKLPDGLLTMRAADKTSQMVMFAMRTNITDRVVESKEPLTTPAGTFQCIRTKQLMKMENKAMGIPMKFDVESVTWYAPGVGQVRTDSYRKGKLAGSTVLTKFSK